jgi:hypothetical protein
MIEEDMAYRSTHARAFAGELFAMAQIIPFVVAKQVSGIKGPDEANSSSGNRDGVTLY